MARLAVSAAALRRETIQRSSMVGAAGWALDRPEACATWSAFMKRKRAAFQILLAMARLAVSAAALRRETIQRSSMVGAAGWALDRPEACATWSAFMKRKRAAFQILLAKARELSMRSSVSTISVPGAAPWRSAMRTASVPYFSVTTRGSMTLPLVLDIFWRSASRTRPWM